MFFPGLKPKAKISKNIDFTEEKLIFSRVRRFKIDQKSKKTRSWRLKFVFGGQKLAMMSILEATKAISEAKIAILEAKRAILEAAMAKLIYDEAILGRSVEWRRPFGYAKSTTSTAGACNSFIRLGILSGCGGF